MLGKLADNSSALKAGTDWTEMGESEHFAQFYEDDSFLIDEVSRFIGAGLGAGERGVVIGTAAHNQGIVKLLRTRGLDVESVILNGDLVMLEADKTLERFMAGDKPDRARFMNVIGGVMRKLGEGRRRPRAFGEMVALLWERGNRSGALLLEEMWNDLGTMMDFALFCAYPLSGFGDETGVSIKDVCACHRRVLPAESYLNLANDNERLRAVSVYQQKARALEAEIERRKEVEKLLERRDKELSDFLENAVEGLHKVGPDGRILWANKAELELLGYREDEYVGHMITEFHADPATAREMLGKLLAGEELYDFPARLRCKDGSVREVMVHSNAYFENGKFMHSRCFTRDVTKLREVERRQRELIESERGARMAMERASRMKDDFVATVSHELRTPLNAIYGWTQIIKGDPSDKEAVTEGIAAIDRNVRSQVQLIEDLLDMSRIISGKMHIAKVETELAEVMEGAVEAIRLPAETKGVSVSVQKEAESMWVMGDGNRLRQVIWNLLTNAVKFTPSGGQIVVKLRRDGNWGRIMVSDTGQGIRQEFLPRVFERFEQADSSMARRHGGLGIGLSIVKQLVEMHEGTIEARSDGEGMGATFVVSLPVHDGKHSVSPERKEVEAQAELKGVRVLVVDDEADARQLVMRILRERGAEVAGAGTVQEALSEFSQRCPQVLITDLSMPGKDGYELVREVRKALGVGGKVLAIALTAFTRVEDHARSMEEGFAAHLTKPLQPEELVRTVARLAGG